VQPNRFHTVLEAKDFIAAVITGEAQRQGTPLSEIERKMLYFSEGSAMRPEMQEVSDTFDRDYDQKTYEKKIEKLIQDALKRSRDGGGLDYSSWRDAIRRLRKGDHYILVIIDSARASVRPLHDRLRLWTAGFAVVVVLGFVGFLLAKYNIDPDRYLPSRYTRDDLFLAVWGTAAGAVILGGVLRVLLGADKFDLFFNAAMRRVLRVKEKDE